MRLSAPGGPLAGLLVAGLLVAGLLVAGCSGSSGHVTASSTPVSTPTVAPSTSAAPTSAPPAPPSVSVTATTPAPTVTPTVVSSSAAPSSPAAAVIRCTASQLSIDVTKGGASLGQEIAVVTFTNTSTSRCTLSGYPQAVLETSAGMTVGQQAKHAAGRVTLVLLAPQRSAQANLTDDTRCNAPESTAVRISAPGVPGATEVPVQLRACTLQITPLQG
ncbi:DUF4232 domain-containing protein [Jatrophihabitans sp.]|uniref:DUF4232 domain-containing protein n=1 Tax=Jatrophihabitans sp. TaxID=1932789 RepID=UPI0030C75C11|nr:lipoprotein [Jatrophihabitans sp.]